MKCTGIVLAAGQGKRMNSKIQKQFLCLQGYPVLYYSLKAFQECPWMQEVVLVTGLEEIEYCRKEIVEHYGFTKVKAVVAGGKERYHSVQNGLKACETADYVFIHDGVAGMPSKDTVKLVDERGVVCSTPDRKRVWNVQTPQVFSYALIADAYEKALQGDCTDITDDAMVVEKYGSHPVKLYEGSYENIKLTTPEDLPVAETFMAKNGSVFVDV